MTVRNVQVDLRERSRAHQLTAELQDLSIRVDEAQVELAVGVASSDLFMQKAAARRIQSLGFLMGDLVRKHERGQHGGQGRGLRRTDETGQTCCGRCGQPYDGKTPHGPRHCKQAR
jgi:hypothetical protein